VLRLLLPMAVDKPSLLNTESPAEMNHAIRLCI